MSIGWVLLGTGRHAGRNVMPQMSKAAGTRLAAVVSRDRARGEAFARRHGFEKVYDSLAQALRDPDIDALYDATPDGLHAANTIAAAKAGKHVLVEKPLGLDGADARRIVRAAEAAGRRCGCAYYRRCFRRFAHLKELLDRDALGRIVLVRTSYLAWFDPQADDPKAWRVDPLKAGGGPLADMGSHMMDLVIGLFGMPRTVFARTDTLVHGYPVEDSSAVLMTLPGGAQAIASFGWSSRAWVHDFEVLGAEGGVRWSPADSGEIVFTAGRESRKLDLPGAANIHQPLIEDFNRAILEDRQPVATAAEALKTNLLLDAIYRSAQTGREVLIERETC